MLFNQLYYRFKPYLPWQWRMNARHVVAQAQRRMYADTWPIDVPSGIAPANCRAGRKGKNSRSS